MGRLSASGARLHELRQPKPNNAAFRQSRPPRSHGSSLGPEHPQRAIPPACREGPTLGVDVIGPPPVPPARRKQEPPRRVRTRRGGQGERSPPPPLGTPPAACPLKAPRGCCPGRAAARRTPAALPIAAHGRACPKGPENGLGAGSCADASAQSAMRHRMRRRKGDQLYEVKG